MPNSEMSIFNERTKSANIWHNRVKISWFRLLSKIAFDRIHKLYMNMQIKWHDFRVSGTYDAHTCLYYYLHLIIYSYLYIATHCIGRVNNYTKGRSFKLELIVSMRSMPKKNENYIRVMVGRWRSEYTRYVVFLIFFLKFILELYIITT